MASRRVEHFLKVIRDAPTSYEDCCEFGYICPTTHEAACLRHGQFDNCCNHPKCPGNADSGDR